MPTDFAASICPRSTAPMPARMISLMNAPSLIASATMPATAAPSTVKKPEVDGAREQVEAEEQVGSEVHEEHLHDHGCPAEEPHVEPREDAQDAHLRHLGERGDQPEDDAERLREDRDPDGGEHRMPGRAVREQQVREEDMRVEGDCEQHAALSASAPCWTSSTWRGSSSSCRWRRAPRTAFRIAGRERVALAGRDADGDRVDGLAAELELARRLPDVVRDDRRVTEVRVDLAGRERVAASVSLGKVLTVIGFLPCLTRILLCAIR